jgi:hypothetical protein
VCHRFPSNTCLLSLCCCLHEDELSAIVCTGMIHFALLVDPEEPTLVYAGGTCQLCMPSVLGSTSPTGRLFRGNMYVRWNTLLIKVWRMQCYHHYTFFIIIHFVSVFLLYWDRIRPLDVCFVKTCM